MLTYNLLGRHAPVLLSKTAEKLDFLLFVGYNLVVMSVKKGGECITLLLVYTKAYRGGGNVLRAVANTCFFTG
jgi:hypothetical protein